MASLQEFMTALRSGNLEQARQVYSIMVPRNAEESMFMNRQQDELTVDKSPRKWREDAASTTRRAGANRTGASLITGDNPLGVGAVDIAAPTAIPAAVADFGEAREGVRRGEVGPLEYAATAAAIPLSALPAGAAAGKALSRGAKVADKAGEAVVKQTRKLFGQEVPMSVRMPDELTTGQKLAIANKDDIKLPSKYGVEDVTQYGELDQRPFYIPSAPTTDKAQAELELAQLNKRPNGSTYAIKETPAVEIKPEANPARSREDKYYYHGIKPKTLDSSYKTPEENRRAIDSAQVKKNAILDEGFKEGASAELGDAGTSVSGDPTMSLRNFAQGRSENMLVVRLENAVNTQNTDPYTYLMKEHRSSNPAAVRKPNVFKEDETFFRTSGGGQQELRAREVLPEEINFMERGSRAISDTYKDVFSLNNAKELLNLGIQTPQKISKDIYNMVKDATQGVSNLREFGRASSTSAAYDVANNLVRGLGKNPSKIIARLGPTQASALSDTYGWATDLNKARSTFETVSNSLRYDSPIRLERANEIAKEFPDVDFSKIFAPDTSPKSQIIVPGEETKSFVNNLYSSIQSIKTKFLDSADKLSVALAAGAGAMAATGTEANARENAELNKMDAAAALPNKKVLEELKSVRDMIRAAKEQDKLTDKDTLKAIAARHKAILAALIDDATE
jgi:hypothetical protein